MNKQKKHSIFEEYATNQAFALSLSRRQVQILLAYYRHETDLCMDNLNFLTLNALQRRGLIYWKYDDGPDELATGGPYITKPGKLICQLLECAGF